MATCVMFLPLRAEEQLCFIAVQVFISQTECASTSTHDNNFVLSIIYTVFAQMQQHRPSLHSQWIYICTSLQRQISFLQLDKSNSDILYFSHANFINI